MSDDITLKPHIIITGNPGEGFECYGPFPTFMAAANHADNDGNLPDNDWWIMPLHSVEDRDLCPICGEHITLTGEKTKDGRLIGSCGDAFTKEQWEAE